MKRDGSVPGRRSGDMITGITEEEEEEEEEEGLMDEDGEMEDLMLDEGEEGEGEEDRFGPALLGGDAMRAPDREESKEALSPGISPLLPSPSGEEAALGAASAELAARKEVRLSVPLTAEALAKMEAEEEAKALRSSS